MAKEIKGKKVLEKGSGLVHEFKDFISRGNVLDMAVGVIIGGAFGKIVTSLVDNILMPIIGVIIGGHDFSDLSFKVGDANIEYGLFIQNVVDFLIVAACIFFVVKAFNKVAKKKEETPTEEPAPVKDEQVLLLEEIRDLLKKKK